MQKPILGVVIPVFNRPDLLRYSLSSVHAASASTPLEVVVVDDGSTEPPDKVIGEFTGLSLQLLRQQNSGSIPARLAGFRATKARYVQFLDSDDLVAPEKFRCQIDELERTGADLAYSDGASVVLDRPYGDLHPAPEAPFQTAASLAEFCFRVQPSPHAAIYRHELLEAAFNMPIVPPARIYDPVGDAWLFYNLSVLAGTVLHTPGPWAIVGRHSEVRYSQHWEVLGVAAWHMMREFHQRCPRTAETKVARQLFGETCLAMWRALPREFNSNLEESLLKMWGDSPISPSAKPGGRWFSVVAHLIGVPRAARLFRRLQRPRYEKIATLGEGKLQAIISGYGPRP